MTTEMIVDLSDIGGGSVDVYLEYSNSDGYEVRMYVRDFNDGWGRGATGDATAIMDSNRARKLAEILLKQADECERLNKDNKSGTE